jgi:hypothetical protein
MPRRIVSKRLAWATTTAHLARVRRNDFYDPAARLTRRSRRLANGENVFSAPRELAFDTGQKDSAS